MRLCPVRQWHFRGFSTLAKVKYNQKVFTLKKIKLLSPGSGISLQKLKLVEICALDLPDYTMNHSMWIPVCKV